MEHLLCPVQSDINVTKEFLENYGVPVPPLPNKVIAENSMLLAQVDSTKARPINQNPETFSPISDSVAAVNGQLTKRTS